MKRQYEKPTCMVAAISTDRYLLNASDPQVGYDPDKDPIEPGTVDARRRRTVWDDDEEEDDEF